MDSCTDATIAEFRRRLESRYGPRFRDLIVFGSRARGDYGDESDVDVAVVLDRIEDRFDEGDVFDHIAMDVLLERGLVINAWPVTEADLAHPSSSYAPGLLRSIVEEGMRQ